MNSVFPTIAEVIFVDELEALAFDKLIQTIALFAFQLFTVSILFFGLAVILIVNDELVQMTVRPAHNNLQDGVQLV